MAKKSLTLNNLQVRYDSATAEITLTSKDPALKKKPFILTLSGDTPTYDTLFELLDEAGLATTDSVEIPKLLTIGSGLPLGIQEDTRDFIHLGETFLGEPVGLDLEKEHHTLIGGVAGAGKTSLQRLVVAHALRHRDEIDLYGVDLKGKELAPLFGYHKENVASTLEETVHLLKRLKQVIIDRCTLLSRNEKASYRELKMNPVYLVVDELELISIADKTVNEVSLLDVNKVLIARQLERIVRYSKGTGVHVFIGTKFPTSSVLSAEFNAALGNRILMGSAGSVAAQLALGHRPKFGGALLRNPGRAILSTEGEDTLVQTYFLKPEDVRP